jgi:cytochrome P450
VSAAIMDSSNIFQITQPYGCLACLSALLSIIAAILIVSLCIFIQKRREAIARLNSCNVPLVGEPGLFGGNLWQVISKPNNCQLFNDYHEKLGDTYGLFYGPDPWIMTIDLELIQRVFITEGNTHIDVTQFRLPFVTEINESLAQVCGDKWRTTRRIMGPSFTPKSMKSDNVFKDISAVCDMFERMLLVAESHEATAGGYSSSSNNGLILDVGYEFKKYSLEVIFRVAFGSEHADGLVLGEKDELIDWLDEGSHMINCALVRIGIMFGFARRLLGFLSGFTPLGACIKHVHSIIDENLRRRRLMHVADSGQQKIDAADRKMIDSLIERFNLGKMDDETLKANLFFILLAGHETSANTLAVMFWLLANNESVQEKLRRLIVNEGDQAEYLNWVIWETLRLYPPVPAAIGRVLEHDIDHGEVHFHKGTTIIANIWTLHRCRKYWGDDADSFRPERFGQQLQAEEALAAGHNHHHHQQQQQQWQTQALRFFAFGEGPRYCIGKHLALVEIKAIVVRLLVKYRVSVCEQSPDEIRTISPNLIHYIITHPVRLAFTRITNL